MNKGENKEINKRFKEEIQKHSDEIGWWEPTAYHRALWKTECILNKILKEFVKDGRKKG